MAGAMTLNRNRALLSIPIALPALLLLGGCAAQGTFPSLARRAQEDVPGRVSGTAQPAPPSAAAAPLPAPRPADTASVGELRSAASAAHARFTAQRDQVDALTRAARDAAPGSEAWATASVALAGLRTDHDALVGIQADLDGIDTRRPRPGDRMGRR